MDRGADIAGVVAPRPRPAAAAAGVGILIETLAIGVIGGIVIDDDGHDLGLAVERAVHVHIVDREDNDVVVAEHALAAGHIGAVIGVPAIIVGRANRIVHDGRAHHDEFFCRHDCFVCMFCPIFVGRSASGDASLFLRMRSFIMLWSTPCFFARPVLLWPDTRHSVLR